MKNKILIILPVVMCSVFYGNAQNNSSDANKQQAEVMVNGKPYAQYKAEQDALKQAALAQKVVVPQFTAVSATPEQTKAVAPQEKPIVATPVKRTMTVSNTVVTEPNINLLNRMPVTAGNGGGDLLNATDNKPVATTMPVQVNNQAKAMPVEDVKPSVIPVAAKVPVLQMQSTEKPKGKE